MKEENGMKIDTKCLHAGYEPHNGEPRQVPIYQSTTLTWKNQVIFTQGCRTLPMTQ